MESHVSGGTTPLSIGELRQAILIVLIGNRLFTEEEQLLANHLTYECEDVKRLVQWLRNVRLEDAKRGRHSRMLAALDANQQAVCLSEATHLAEMNELLKCGILDKWQQDNLLSYMANAGRRPSNRLQWLGCAYIALLENLGRMPKPARFEALNDN